MSLFRAPHSTSSAAGVASAGGDPRRGPSVGDVPGVGDPRPTGAGHTHFTVGELEDAAYAVRRHIKHIVTHSDIGAEAWRHLAEKLEAAALEK